MRTNIIVTWHSVLKDIDDLIKSEAAIAESVEVISDVERSAGGAEPDQYTKLNLMSDRLTFKRKEGETRILGFAAADMMGTFADLNNRAFGKASPSEAEIVIFDPELEVVVPIPIRLSEMSRIVSSSSILSD